MMCTPSSPPLSPAGSEISVGAPSPPPQQQQNATKGNHPERRRIGDDYLEPLKRLKGIGNARERSASPPAQRSTLEGVKSFSIADILGHDTNSSSATNNTTTASNQQQIHHQTNSKIVRPWDHLRGSVHAVRPFLPPALLHYEHRLALDYHRHLEHLNAQAQLLRHMNINMSMDIKSESGSERSSSTASDCCSPEIGSSGSRLSEHHIHHSGSQQQQSSPSSHHHSSSQSHSQKTKPNGTPLDALFQMTNKPFDENQGECFVCFIFKSFSNDRTNALFLGDFLIQIQLTFVKRMKRVISGVWSDQKRKLLIISRLLTMFHRFVKCTIFRQQKEKLKEKSLKN